MPYDDPLNPIEVTIVMPCLNEERTVGTCIQKVKKFLRENQIHGEIIIADNGSADQSVQLARSLGACIVHVSDKGYGSALRGGFQQASGKYIIMADADDSYDLENLMPFIDKLREGYDLVMGNRFKGRIHPGAMPWHHRYIGNPVLSGLGRLFFRTPSNDFHCGLRGFSIEAMRAMNLQSAGMELASEIVIKASLLDMKVCEVPTQLFPDGRDRPPHLRSFRDGWRHLRFLLLFSPRWLFAYPGAAFVAVGLLFSVLLLFGPLHFQSRLIDFHTFILSGTLLIIGINLLSFYAITRVYTFYRGLLPKPPVFFRAFKVLTLEKGLFLGFLFLLIGLGTIAYAAILSQEPGGFEPLGFGWSVRLVFGGSLALILGTQIVITSFVLSMLGMQAQRQ